MPWSNCISQGSLGTVVCENGGGYTWHDNSGLEKLTDFQNDPVINMPNEYIYIRDEETGRFWNITSSPVNMGDEYKAVHGQGYSYFEYNGFGLEQRQTVFIHRELPVKLYDMHFLNRSGKSRQISITACIEAALGRDRRESVKFLSCGRGEGFIYVKRENKYAYLYISEVFERVLNILTAIPCFADAEDESEYSIWNRQYAKGAQKLGYSFRVIQNQPYINDIPICSEITCHNGVYETFENKKYPVNLIYAMGYDDFNASKIDKVVDFSYPIWSKINRRPEVFDYYSQWEKHGLTFLASSLHNKNYTHAYEFTRSTGMTYLAQLAKANATVYTARDLAYLKMQTARLYEAILANQIVFVDKKSDPDCEILTLMHHDKELIDLLYCTPDDICDKYNDALLIKDKILTNQREYYNKLVNDAKVFTAFETGEIL